MGPGQIAAGKSGRCEVGAVKPGSLQIAVFKHRVGKAALGKRGVPERCRNELDGLGSAGIHNQK